jgi:dihydrofolate reductase
MRMWMKPLNLIAAVARNRVIGKKGDLPWSIPKDTAHFHRATAGHTCILGKICYETWPQAHEEGRHPIVVSSTLEGSQAVTTKPSLVSAIHAAASLDGDIFICGGQRIYEEALSLHGILPLRLILTLVDTEVQGDTFFPDWKHLLWHETSRKELTDAGFDLTILTLESR